MKLKLDELLAVEGCSCDIPYEFLCDMLDMITESGNTGREMAMTFCGTDEGIARVKGKGTELGASAKFCRKGEKMVGLFHTHPSDPECSEKSVGDYYVDLESRIHASCMGHPDVSEYRQLIQCHTYDVNHPDYEKFRQQYLPTMKEGWKHNTRLVKRLFDENKPCSDEEYDKHLGYLKYARNMIADGRRKGIIKDCTPYTEGSYFILSNVNELLRSDDGGA